MTKKFSGRPRGTVDMTILPEELERMATPMDLAQAPQKAQRPAEPRWPALARTGQAQPLRSRHRSRERRAHLRQDAAGVPCACDDKTPCLAHAGITGRRRHVRPR